MSSILIIDDEIDLVTLLKDVLESKGHTVLTATNGIEGIKLAAKQPELIILDIMMPEMDGYEVCKRIRDNVLCPIIFLSAKQLENDRIKGLMLGGDDYLTKPFSLKELLARIEAHLRRESRALLLNERGKRIWLTFKNLSIDLRARQVFIHQKPIPLTKKEFDIVELLSQYPGQVFSKEQIYEKVWGYDAEGDSATITEHVKKIRAKFKKVDSTNYISTVWGIGYRWEKGY